MLNKKRKMISIVVPCYNEEEVLPYFYEEMKKQEEKMDYVNFEYVFVNDGSKDNTLRVLKEFAKKDKSVHFISFSRNFGKEAGMYAGLEHTEEGYDCVGTRRVTRKGEPKIRSFFARMFYKIINKLSDIEMVDGARDFRLMTRQMVDAVLDLKEYNRYTKGLFSFVGFDTKWIEYENVERKAGKTKWSFFGLFSYAIEGIIAFSTKPLIISAMVGFIFFLISFIMIFVIILKTLIFGDPVSGWPSTICIIFFVSGVQLFCLGIMGAYLSKAYMETKERPVYIIKEHDNN